MIFFFDEEAARFNENRGPRQEKVQRVRRGHRERGPGARPAVSPFDEAGQADRCVRTATLGGRNRTPSI